MLWDGKTSLQSDKTSGFTQDRSLDGECADNDSGDVTVFELDLLDTALL